MDSGKGLLINLFKYDVLKHMFFVRLCVKDTSL